MSNFSNILVKIKDFDRALVKFLKDFARNLDQNLKYLGNFRDFHHNVRDFDQNLRDYDQNHGDFDNNFEILTNIF